MGLGTRVTDLPITGSSPGSVVNKEPGENYELPKRTKKKLRTNWRKEQHTGVQSGLVTKKLTILQEVTAKRHTNSGGEKRLTKIISQGKTNQVLN